MEWGNSSFSKALTNIVGHLASISPGQCKPVKTEITPTLSNYPDRKQSNELGENKI